MASSSGWTAATASALAGGDDEQLGGCRGIGPAEHGGGDEAWPAGGMASVSRSLSATLIVLIERCDGTGGEARQDAVGAEHDRLQRRDRRPAW